MVMWMGEIYVSIKSEVYRICLDVKLVKLDLKVL